MKNIKYYDKSMVGNMSKYTRDMDILLKEKKIEEQVSKFCKENQINETDELSLSNYAIVIVEAESLAKSSKQLIEEISKFNTDNFLHDCYKANKLDLGS